MDWITGLAFYHKSLFANCMLNSLLLLPLIISMALVEICGSQFWSLNIESEYKNYCRV